MADNEMHLKIQRKILKKTKTKHTLVQKIIKPLIKFDNNFLLKIKKDDELLDDDDGLSNSCCLCFIK